MSRRVTVSSFLAIVAMLALVGAVLADTGSRHGTKLVPVGKDAASRKAKAAPVTADGSGPSAVSAATRHATRAPLDAPANDDCPNAIAIPDGPFPLITTPVDITDATPQDEDEGVLGCATTDRTIWYTFTPSVSRGYVFSTCEGNGATGNTVYDTVIGVFASIGGACPVNGSQIACNDTATGCGTVSPGAPYVDQSITAAVLSAGTTYYIAVGHWAQDAGGVGPGLNEIAVQVDVSPAPDNDTCAHPAPLTLNRVTQGTTASATNDYRSVGDATCFSGIGQAPTSSAGIDVVYSFTAPADGKYNFRYVQDDANAELRGQNPALYLSDTCPDPFPAGPAVPCIKGANRIAANGAANGNRSEEIDCVPLTNGQQVFLFFDDRAAGNSGGPMAIEVTNCTTETEPNDDVATANPYPGCFTMGSAGSVGDVDFYDLGAPPAGSKVFVGVDAVAANDGDFELRVTNATDTLGYDDNDGSSWISANAPIVGGVIADGSTLYARVNKGSAAAQLAASEPYHLYARIETGVAQNEVDSPDNASYYFGNHVTGGGFVKGIMATQTDQDCFRFVAREGDELVVFSDNNPTRAAGTITNVWPVLRDLTVNAPPTGSRFVGQVVRNIVTPSPGTLTGVTPSITSEFFPYRARYSGTYMACFAPTQDITNAENPLAAAYPLPYQGSISLNCGPVPSPASRVTDVSVTQTIAPGPVNTGSVVDYTITLTNTGTDIAEDVRLVSTLPPELVFLDFAVQDGFGGNNIGCISVPLPGTTGQLIDCTNFSIAPGASTTYFLKAQVANCIGAGIDVMNTVAITMLSTDPNSANDQVTTTFTTVEDGTCNDLLCDEFTCITNACTVNDHCDAGVCVSAPADCDDNSLCTDDTCDPAATGDPCIHDSSQLGDLCFDGNDCTLDSCDPALFCVFPVTAVGSPCDDFLGCTLADACDGAGACVGQSVCDDGLPCTDDFADEFNGCACSNPVSFPGTVCDDGLVCTTGSVCDGNGGLAANCGGGTPRDCDDANPCTDDSCDAVTGCVHVDNTAACDDGNACTSGDTCGGGACNAGAPLVCSDGDACNGLETCAPASGCVAGTPLVCNDGNACNGVETCAPASGCVAGTALVCNDGNGCTDDACAPASGCVFTNNTSACDDGDACTQTDACSGGACVGTNPVACTASDSCHLAGTCAPGTGVCSNPAKANGAACDDGNACTTADTCNGSAVCVGGAAPNCDDGNICTADVCVPATGCAWGLADFDPAGFSASRVDGRDLVVLADAWNSCPSDPRYDAAANLDHDTTLLGACVDLTDFHLFMDAFGQSCP